MASRLNPYLSFRDNARAAMEFYRTVFGGELTLSTFGQGGMPHDPSEADKIMHGQLETPNGFILMGSDVPKDMPYTPGTNYAISLSGDDEAALHGWWAGLTAGGNITLPLDKAPWGDSFGMVIDRFGTSWMFNISPKRA
ncbi:MAG: VOC family protein [Bauldia sp.]|nr:VOC family protein [Bauldia sp.]